MKTPRWQKSRFSSIFIHCAWGGAIFLHMDFGAGAGRWLLLRLSMIWPQHEHSGPHNPMSCNVSCYVKCADSSHCTVQLYWVLPRHQSFQKQWLAQYPWLQHDVNGMMCILQCGQSIAGNEKYITASAENTEPLSLVYLNPHLCRAQRHLTDWSRYKEIFWIIGSDQIRPSSDRLFLSRLVRTEICSLSYSLSEIRLFARNVFQINF